MGFSGVRWKQECCVYVMFEAVKGGKVGDSVIIVSAEDQSNVRCREKKSHLFDELTINQIPRRKISYIPNEACVQSLLRLLTHIQIPANAACKP